MENIDTWIATATGAIQSQEEMRGDDIETSAGDLIVHLMHLIASLSGGDAARRALDTALTHFEYEHEEDTAESQPSEAAEIIAAFADRGPLTNPRWSGDAVWLTEDDDGHDVEVHTPEFGVCRTEVTITADELGDTLPDAPADVVSWLKAHIEALPIKIELTDHEQDFELGEIPRGYFAANPDEDFASDHLRVFASPNGRHTMIDMAQQGGTFFVLVEIGLDVIVEPMSAAAPLVWPPAFTQTAEEDTEESQPSETTEAGK